MKFKRFFLLIYQMGMALVVWQKRQSTNYEKCRHTRIFQSKWERIRCHLYNYFIERTHCVTVKSAFVAFFYVFVRISNCIIWRIQSKHAKCTQRWQLCVLVISKLNAQMCSLWWQINCVFFGTIRFHSFLLLAFYAFLYMSCFVSFLLIHFFFSHYFRCCLSPLLCYNSEYLICVAFSQKRAHFNSEFMNLENCNFNCNTFILIQQLKQKMEMLSFGVPYVEAKRFPFAPHDAIHQYDKDFLNIIKRKVCVRFIQLWQYNIHSDSDGLIEIKMEMK